MTDLEAAARDALAKLYEHHLAEATRIERAIGALNADVVAGAVDPPAPPTVARADPKPQTRATSTPSKAPVKYDPVEVASIARAAHRAGTSMGQAVADRLGIHRQNADELISRYRKNGHDIPRATDPVPAATFPERVLAAAAVDPVETPAAFTCTSCGEVFTERSKLANHTITSHGRGPTPAENKVSEPAA